MNHSNAEQNRQEVLFACGPGWRNGIRRGLKIHRGQPHAGSSPLLGTFDLSDVYSFDVCPRRIPHRLQTCHHARYYWLLLAESHLTRRLFGGMLRKIAALPSPAGKGACSAEQISMTALVWREKCLRMRPGKRILSGRCVLAGGETGPFRCRCEDRGPKPAQTLAASGHPAYTGVGIGGSIRKFRETAVFPGFRINSSCRRSRWAKI